MSIDAKLIDPETNNQIIQPAYFDRTYSADGTKRLDHELERIDADLTKYANFFEMQSIHMGTSDSQPYICVSVPNGAKSGKIVRIIPLGIDAVNVNLTLSISSTNIGLAFAEVSDTTLRTKIRSYSSFAKIEWTF